MRVLYAVLISYALYANQVNLFKFAKELRTAKPEVGIQFTLPLNEIRMQHNVNARDRAYLIGFAKATSVLVERHDCSTFRDGISRS